jgi:hypothetical protein
LDDGIETGVPRATEILHRLAYLSDTPFFRQFDRAAQLPLSALQPVFL